MGRDSTSPNRTKIYLHSSASSSFSLERVPSYSPFCFTFDATRNLFTSLAVLRVNRVRRSSTVLSIQLMESLVPSRSVGVTLGEYPP